MPRVSPYSLRLAATSRTIGPKPAMNRILIGSRPCLCVPFFAGFINASLSNPGGSRRRTALRTQRSTGVKTANRPTSVPCPGPGPGIRPRSLPDAQLAHKIALSNGHSLPAQNVVGRRRMKVKIRLREGQEKILGREVETAVAGDEAHIAADEGVDLGRHERLERGERILDSRLERCERLGRGGHVG